METTTYDLPHSSLRPVQIEAIEAVKRVNADSKVAIVEAPTGTGKSAIGIAQSVAQEMPLVILAHSLSLLDQYGEKYGAAVLKGRQAYSCVHEEKVKKWAEAGKGVPTFAQCHYKEPANECDYAFQCPYLNARDRALTSQRMVCTPKYAALSYKVQERRGMVVVDEAHNVAEEILSFAEFRLDDRERIFYSLPALPLHGYGPNGKGDRLTLDARGQVIDWLMKAIDRLKGMKSDPFTDADKVKALKERLERVAEELDGPTEWFAFCGHEWNAKTAVLSLKPLEASKIAQRLFANKQSVMLMSATIGKPEPIANELGIEKYEYLGYPHPVPVEARPVFDLNVERMTNDNLTRSPILFKLQAEAIADWIESLDPEWRGIVLTTSYKKIEELTKHLGRRLNGRLLTTENKRVGSRIEAFLSNSQRGLVAVDTIQGWGTGLSLDGELARFVVVAGVPHSNPSDAYERARKSRPGGQTYNLWKAYNAVVQASGRVSRGERDGEGWLHNYTALADGSTTVDAALRFYPGWFKEAIR